MRQKGRCWRWFQHVMYTWFRWIASECCWGWLSLRCLVNSWGWKIDARVNRSATSVVSRGIPALLSTNLLGFGSTSYFGVKYNVQLLLPNLGCLSVLCLNSQKFITCMDTDVQEDVFGDLTECSSFTTPEPVKAWQFECLFLLPTSGCLVDDWCIRSLLAVCHRLEIAYVFSIYRPIITFPDYGGSATVTIWHSHFHRPLCHRLCQAQNSNTEKFFHCVFFLQVSLAS